MAKRPGAAGTAASLTRAFLRVARRGSGGKAPRAVIEDKFAAAVLWVDRGTAPAEALDWLTSWLGLADSPGWDSQRKRIFLRYAPTILRQRGTIRGLQWALHLELDPILDER